MQVIVATSATKNASGKHLGEAFKAGWHGHRSGDNLQVVPYSYDFSEVSASCQVGDLFANTTDPFQVGSQLPALLEKKCPIYLPACQTTAGLQSEYLPNSALTPPAHRKLSGFPDLFISGIARAYGEEQPSAQTWENLVHVLRNASVVCASRKPLFSSSGVLSEIAKTDPETAQKTKENWEKVLGKTEVFGASRYLKLTNPTQGAKNTRQKRRGHLSGGGAGWGVGELLASLGARIDFVADFLDAHTRLPQFLASADLLVANTAELSPWNLSGSPLEHLCHLSAPSGIPIVVVTSENNLSRGESAEMGIDGIYQFPADIAGMKQAGLRLARTWSR